MLIPIHFPQKLRVFTHFSTYSSKSFRNLRVLLSLK